MNQIQQKNQCPRWDSCSANYCPIDGGNVHLRDEATCYYMREVLKGVPADLFKGDGEPVSMGIEDVLSGLEGDCHKRLELFWGS